MGIRRFQKQLLMTLMGWAMSSIVLGLVMRRGGDSFRAGVGEQFVGWGVINGLIATAGSFGTQRRAERTPTDSSVSLTTEKRNLATLLWVNAGLDVFYVIGGALYGRKQGATDGHRRGRGVGIIIQGGFLFFFDLINAIRVGRIEVGEDSQL